MSNLRVYMGGPPDLSTVSAGAGHASLTIVGFDAVSGIETVASVASISISSLTATTDAAGAPTVLTIGSSNVSTTSATISWTLDLAGTGQVEFGETTSYGSTTTASVQYLTSHVQNITTGNPGPLTPGTTYHYRVVGTSEQGQPYASEDQTFTTDAAVTSAAGPRPAPDLPSGANVIVIGTDTAAVADDNTGAVQSQLASIINSAPAGSYIRFAQSRNPVEFEHGDTLISHYRITDNINLNSIADNVTLWMYGARITRVGNSGDNNAASFVLNTAGVTGTTFAGGELYGGNSAYSRTSQMFSGLSSEGQSGIQMRQYSQGTIIEDMLIHHHNGDGVQQVGWNWSLPLYNMGDVTVRYNEITDSGRMGINPNVGRAINNTYGWDIHHNILEHQAGRNINAEDLRETNYPPNPHLSMHIWANDFGPTGWQTQGTGGVSTNVFGVMAHIILLTNTATQDWGTLGPFYIHDNNVSGMMPAGTTLPGTRLFFDNIGSYGPSAPSQAVPVAGLRVEDNVFDLSPWPQPSTGSISAVRCAKVTDVDVHDNTFQGFFHSSDVDGSKLNSDVSYSGNT